MQLQQTLRKNYSFEGKGLHTGKVAKMIVGPAPADTGIVFRRTDLGEGMQVEALAENVSNTARSTTISKGEASVSTIEHILSALTGMGVDNAYIDIDNVEVPILDGSAKPYIDAIWKDGFQEQDQPRRYIEVKETVSEPDGAEDKKKIKSALKATAEENRHQNKEIAPEDIDFKEETKKFTENLEEMDTATDNGYNFPPVSLLKASDTSNPAAAAGAFSGGYAGADP